MRYVGEQIAVLIAENAQAARDGAEAVSVEYADLPAVANLHAALAAEAPQLWTEAPSNIACEARDGTWSEVERTFAGAAHRPAKNHRLRCFPTAPPSSAHVPCECWPDSRSCSSRH